MPIPDWLDPIASVVDPKATPSTEPAPQGRGPLRRARRSLSDFDAKAAICDAFVREMVDCPRHLMRDVDRNYFEPAHDEFRPRTLYSLQNAFTRSFHKLEPVPMHRATSSAGEYFAAFRQ
jgi:hypothetical protein